MAKWNDGKYWVSKYNFDEEFTRELNIAPKVEIHDATLRDGEQTPGVFMSTDQKVEIAAMLDELGVERIEAGMPAVSSADFNAIKQITSSGTRAKVYSFARGMHEDIEAAKECGATGVVIEIPTSEVKLKYQFPKWDTETLIQKSVDSCAYAKKLGLETIYFGFDTCRADMATLDRLYSTLVAEARPDAIGVVDTVGCCLPSAVHMFIRRLKKYGVPLQIHTHNDFGMATASSFAAMEAGANVIHTCMNGLGERTGNAATEQIMMGMKLMYGLDNDYRLEQIKESCERVAAMCKRPLAYNAPFVGANTFARESGIGIDLVKHNPVVMFSIDPAIVGNDSLVVLGKGSGKMSVPAKCEELGIPYTLNDEQTHEVVGKIKALAIEKQSTVTNEEFVKILSEVK